MLARWDCHLAPLGLWSKGIEVGIIPMDSFGSQTLILSRSVADRWPKRSPRLSLVRIRAFAPRVTHRWKRNPAPLRCSMAAGAVCRPLCEDVWVQRGYIFSQIPAWSEFRSTLQTSHGQPWRASAWLNDRSRHEQKALANTPSECRSFCSFLRQKGDDRTTWNRIQTASPKVKNCG